MRARRGALELILLLYVIVTLIGSPHYDLAWLMVVALMLVGFAPIVVALIFTVWAARRPSEGREPGKRARSSDAAFRLRLEHAPRRSCAGTHRQRCRSARRSSPIFASSLPPMVMPRSCRQRAGTVYGMLVAADPARPRHPRHLGEYRRRTLSRRDPGGASRAACGVRRWSILRGRGRPAGPSRAIWKSSLPRRRRGSCRRATSIPYGVGCRRARVQRGRATSDSIKRDFRDPYRERLIGRWKRKAPSGFCGGR